MVQGGLKKTELNACMLEIKFQSILIHQPLIGPEKTLPIPPVRARRWTKLFLAVHLGRAGPDAHGRILRVEEDTVDHAEQGEVDGRGGRGVERHIRPVEQGRAVRFGGWEGRVGVGEEAVAAAFCQNRGFGLVRGSGMGAVFGAFAFCRD